MLFQKREDFLAQTTGHALGASISKEITREFHIEAIFIKLTGTLTGAIATATTDGLLGALKSVQLTVADGARTRNVVNCSGRALLELAMHWNGGLDRQTNLAKDVVAATSYTITYPIFCALPQVSDPVGSFFMLPAPRYNANLQLQLQLASQTDLDSNATPTAAISAGWKCDVIVHRRNVTVPNFQTVDWELMESTVAYTASAAGQSYELQTPGSYTGILLRAYTDTTSATGRGDISQTNGEFKLDLLGNIIRRFRLVDVEINNTYSIFPQAGTTSGVGTYFAGSYYIDFLTDKVGQEVGDLGSMLDANVVAGTGARLRLLQDIAGGSNVQLKYLTHRVFGNLAALKMQPASAKAA